MSTRTVTLGRIDALEYRMPLKRPYGTARGVTRAAGNFVVRVTAHVDGVCVQGVGECQPRHDLTGDGDKKKIAAWRFLSAACAWLQDQSLDAADAEAALSSVRRTMASLDELARTMAVHEHREKPFRGTLLGIEVALLDLLSRSLGIEVADVLGKRREEVGISISTISSTTGMDMLEKKLTGQSRFPMTRVKGSGQVEDDLALMEEVARINAGLGRDKAIWIDINEAHDMETAERFVRSVAGRMGQGSLPRQICIEGMLPKAQGDRLAGLQRLADTESVAGSGKGLDLRIMPDEGLWDLDDLGRLNELGGCRAINIKAPKAGGLIASLDLANAAVRANPDVHICIGGMVGTSDLTTWALYNLAKAMPRIDYITAVPPGNVEQRITSPLAGYASKGSNILAKQVQAGIGTELDVKKLRPYLRRVSIFGDRTLLADEPTC